MGNHERLPSNQEQEFNPDKLAEIGEKQREKLIENLEKADKPKETLEETRHEALERAQSIEQRKEKEPSHSPERRTGPISKKEREASYEATLDEIRTHMSASSRTFSKVIHNKTVEKISDVAANTIVRPNAVLLGSIFAFVFTLAVYLIAKNLGYPLSGFETIGAFVLGWVLGLAYDFVKTMATGRK